MSLLCPAVDDPWWIERAVAALDPLATVATEVLEARLRAWGLCLLGPVIDEPLDPPCPPIDEPYPDRWLAAWLCAGCPVHAECLEVELRGAGADTVGVWGGLTEDDRRALVDLWQAHPDRGPWAVVVDTAEQEGEQR